MGSKDSSKPLMVKIISPEGIFYDSMKIPKVSIISIVAKGVIPSKGEFPEIKGEAARDFEILPDHSPFVAKVLPKSEIRISGNNINSNYLKTERGGIVTVSYTDNHTLVVFTLQDVKEDPSGKN
jgi:F0F1-type ATP synthase epsilon subunit